MQLNLSVKRQSYLEGNSCISLKKKINLWQFGLPLLHRRVYENLLNDGSWIKMVHDGTIAMSSTRIITNGEQRRSILPGYLITVIVHDAPAM